jgi:ABC-type multidrug transport system ATPase subunit
MVEIEGLTYRYRSGAGIYDVSLTAAGITGVVGRNGAGKTTFFSCLTGFLDRQAGRILVDGRPCDPRREPWGWAPSEDYFLDHLTGRQNLEYQSYLKTGRGDRWQAWTAWVDQLELGPVLDRPFREYSTGTKKKVQLLNSLVGDPRVLVWDEPHNGVDLVSNAVVGRLLAELASQGRTILLSSHVAEVLVALCHSIVVIRDGTVSAHLVPPFPVDLVPLL